MRKFAEDRNLSSSYIFILVLAICCCVLVKTNKCPVEASIVSGNSMESTLHNKDKGIILKVGTIKRYDIIVFSAVVEGKASLLVKRVIGLPGDHVVCKGNTVYVNGDPITEFAKDTKYNFDFAEEIVPDNCYFVLGDNREVSLDSRYDEIGFVPFDTVIGIFYKID